MLAQENACVRSAVAVFSLVGRSYTYAGWWDAKKSRLGLSDRFVSCDVCILSGGSIVRVPFRGFYFATSPSVPTTVCILFIFCMQTVACSPPRFRQGVGGVYGGGNGAHRAKCCIFSYIPFAERSFFTFPLHTYASVAS